MALPRHLKNGLTPAEIEFLAERETIKIQSNTDSRQKLELIGGTLPALRTLEVTEVPIWMAISLKKKRKCNIITPTWMTVESLTASLKQEQDQSDRFSVLPYHYMEIAQMLLENACDDIVAADKVRILLKDILEARQSKARQGFAALGGAYLQMDNISLMEINEIRPFFTKAFHEIQKLAEATRTNEEEYTQQTVGTNRTY